MAWQEKVFDQEIATTLERSTDISPFLAKLLAERNIESVEDANDFLCPKLAHLHDPFDITNMDRAVGRIKDAIKNKEEVLLIGDYDVDGISSITILSSFFKHLKHPFKYVIPDRFIDGYGPNIRLLDQNLDKEVENIIFLDCFIKKLFLN